MPWRDGSGQEAAIDYLMNRRVRGGGRPDGLLDRTLLAYPDAFGAELAQPLAEARALVLRDGDAHSRDILAEEQHGTSRDGEIRRTRLILARRPQAIEQAAPALVRVSERMLIALAHPVPGAAHRLAVRIQLELHPEVAHVSASRCEPGADLLAEWAALGHTAPPHAVWTCEPPGWCIGGEELALAIEVLPNASGFSDAWHIAHSGAARALVLDRSLDPVRADPVWRAGRVMPSGWSHLCGDRTMGSSPPTMPNGAPYPATHVRVPDDDLFAACAARSWAGSLRDSVWLRRRDDFRLLAGGSTTTHGMNGETR